MKFDLGKDFRALCAAPEHEGPLIFGDNLQERIREVSEANRMARQVAPAPQARRPFLAARPRFPSQNFSFNARKRGHEDSQQSALPPTKARKGSGQKYWKTQGPSNNRK